MLKNFNVPIKNLEGGNFKDGEKDILLKNLCINALYAVEMEGNSAKRLSGEDHMSRHRLAKKLYGSESEVEVSSEEITLMKRLIALNYAPSVVGPAFELLEG